MEPVNIAVVGAGGYFASRFIEKYYKNQKYNIIPILRSYKSMARLCKLGMDSMVIGKSTEPSLSEALHNVDVVLNFSAGPWLEMMDTVETLYKVTAKNRIPLFVQLSSAVVFGSVMSEGVNDDAESNEADWFLYAREKKRIEEFLKAQMGKGPTQIVVLRPGLIWGPMSSWVTRAATEIRTGNAILANSGQGVCNLCYADNLAMFIMAVVDARSPRSGFYNVSDIEIITWEKFYRDIAEGIGCNANLVRTTREKRNKLSAAILLEWLKSNRLGNSIIQILLKRLRPKTRSLIKWYLPIVAMERICPPVSDIDQLPIVTNKKFSREMWMLHHTRHKLNSKKFENDFGKPAIISYRDAMTATAKWLRAVGY